MRVHDLKCWPNEFRAILRGEKTHEVRVNDRDYRLGDVLHLREWDAAQYSGDELMASVTNITAGGTFGLPGNVVCMSIKVLVWDVKP